MQMCKSIAKQQNTDKHVEAICECNALKRDFKEPQEPQQNTGDVQSARMVSAHARMCLHDLLGVGTMTEGN